MRICLNETVSEFTASWIMTSWVLLDFINCIVFIRIDSVWREILIGCNHIISTLPIDNFPIHENAYWCGLAKPEQNEPFVRFFISVFIFGVTKHQHKHQLNRLLHLLLNSKCWNKTLKEKYISIIADLIAVDRRKEISIIRHNH